MTTYQTVTEVILTCRLTAQLNVLTVPTKFLLGMHQTLTPVTHQERKAPPFDTPKSSTALQACCVSSLRPAAAYCARKPRMAPFEGISGLR
jgi:hypothetical protein